MPITLPTNPNDSLRPFTAGEVELMNIRTRGVRDGSHPTETRRVGASTTKRAFFCDWDQQENFLIHMLGAVKTYEDGDTTRLSRLIPQRHPRWPDLVCASLESLSGHVFLYDDEATGMPVYQDAECVFQFDHFPFDVGNTDDETPNERLRNFQVLPSQTETQYLSLPGGILKYIRPDATGRPHGVPIQSSVGFTLSTTVIARKWVRLPYNAWGEGSTLRNRVFGDHESGTRPVLGTINSNTYMGYPPGTLLFLGVDEDLYPSVLGEGLNWDLTMRWLHKADGHNWFYYFETDPAKIPDNRNGWYFVGKGGTYYPSSELPDDYSLFSARDHASLQQVGGVG